MILDLTDDETSVLRHHVVERIFYLRAYRAQFAKEGWSGWNDDHIRFLETTLEKLGDSQVVVLAMGSAALTRECLHCGADFPVGSESGRRRDAKFCCDRHRIDFNSQKRSGKRKNG